MRFTLQTLLLSVVVICSAMAAFGLWGIVIAAVLLGTAAIIRHGRSPSQAAALALRIIGIGFGLLCVAGILSVFLPHSYDMGPRRRSHTLNRLLEIGLALQSYHDAHGCFLPAYVADESGKPVHSWRVLILPYLHNSSLYHEYDFSQPWNGPKNRQWATVVRQAFTCPRDPGPMENPGTTSYFAVIGPRTAWPGPKSISKADIRDGPENMIMVVEVPNSGICWMDPKDLSFEQAVDGINQRSGFHIRGHPEWDHDYFHREAPVISVLFADGSVRCLPVDITPTALEALLTVNGNEQVDIPEGRMRRFNWGKPVALLVLSFAAALLFWVERAAEA